MPRERRPSLLRLRQPIRPIGAAARMMVRFHPADPMPSGVLGQAMSRTQSACAAMLRRSALVELARASAEYEPASFDDAVATRDQVTRLLIRKSSLRETRARMRSTRLCARFAKRWSRIWIPAAGASLACVMSRLLLICQH